MRFVAHCLLSATFLSGAVVGSLAAQEPATDPPVIPNVVSPEKSSAETITDNAAAATDEAKKKVEELAREVDKSPQAREISAGILQPIYQFAEQLSFPFFHWVAFTVMAAGVVSYALQLVLGKLVVLTKMGFSLSEILADAHGLVISLVGLVLTTQAAAENSTFTQSPFAVISAALVGAVVGFIFYLWGQAQEVQAAKARGMMPVKK